jgi:hypothetical protein
MPNENDPALNTIADIAQAQDGANTDDANTSAEQGPAPAELPPQPDIQPIQPGERLSAAQVEALMGGTEAGSAHDLDVREGVDHNTES